MSLEQIVLRISRPSIIPEGKYIKQGNLWKDGRKTEDFYIFHLRIGSLRSVVLLRVLLISL